MEKVNSKEIKIKRILIITVIVMLGFSLVFFLSYEVFFVDIFNIFKKEKEVQENEVVYVNETNDNNVVAEEENNENQNINNNTNNNNVLQTSHYYYNQLDDTSKTIYEALEGNIENLKTGTYEINFGTQFNSIINVDEGGMEKLNNAFQSAWNAFTYDNVDVFYIDASKLILTTKITTIGELTISEVTLSKDSNDNYLIAEIKNEEEVNKRVNHISEMRKNIVSLLEGYTNYEKIKFLHNWMVDTFKYDKEQANENRYNVYGAFSNGNIVCEGYSRTFKYVLDGLGIESILVSGVATNSNGEEESHMWNYILLDGKWYAVDVTWDDPIIEEGGTLTEELRYKYFMKGSDDFMQKHKENGILTENSTQFIYPILEKENY